MLVASLVLGLAAISVQAVTISHTVTKEATYVVNYAGTTTTVTVYKLSFSAPAGWVIGAVGIDIGTDACDPCVGDDQVV
jgi:hypothetical protein